MHFGFFGIVILLFIAYLIIKPFLRGNRRYYEDRYDSRVGYGGNYGGYGSGYGRERSGWGMAAGGFAAGALLTWLLEEGRIDSHQYDYYNSLGDQQMIDELMQQNLLQQQEIDDLYSRMNDGGYDNGGYDNGYESNGYDDNYDNGNSYADSYDDGGGWDDGNGSGGDDGNWM